MEPLIRFAQDKTSFDAVKQHVLASIDKSILDADTDPAISDQALASNFRSLKDAKKHIIRAFSEIARLASESTPASDINPAR